MTPKMVSDHCYAHITLIPSLKLTSQSFFEALLLGLGAGLGFGLLLLMFAALREHQSALKVPKPFQGAAINMITAGLIALGFSGLTAMHFS